jgi:hypothetical protein
MPTNLLARVRTAQCVSLGLGLWASVAIERSAFAAESAPGVSVREEGDRVRVETGDSLFTEYHYRGVPRPYFYPLIGPGGRRMTRHWPMEEYAGEERDHVHHRSLWFTHGDVNGVDFWSESAQAGKILHEAFTGLSSGAREGVIRSRNRWIAPGGRIVCTDERMFRVYAPEGGQGTLFDFEVTVYASNGDLVFGDTKEGSMAIRLAESMRLVRDKKPGLGHIVNSNGVRDGRTWGLRAGWVDYYGPVDGQTVGVAIFDHPANPRHPTWWHVRDYGLFAANPFGVHDFERRPPGTGKLELRAGYHVTFRYRFYLHEGDEAQARVRERHAEYLAGVGKPGVRR